MIRLIWDFLKGLPPEAITVAISALPISELRGSIPVAILKLDQPVYKTLFLSYIGNMVPVIPLLVMLEPVSAKLRRFSLFKRFFDWLFERTRKRADIVERYEALGLIILVAIPLPATGAWTGCIAASLFKIRFRYAFTCILTGVVIAGLIVTALTLTGIWIIDLSFVK